MVELSCCVCIIACVRIVVCVFRTSDVVASSHGFRVLQFKTVVMLNCGGIVDLSELVHASSDDLVFYVIDHHRPLNLENVYAESQVVVFGTDSERKDIPPFELVFDTGESGAEDSPDSRASDEVRCFCASHYVADSQAQTVRDVADDDDDDDESGDEEPGSDADLFGSDDEDGPARTSRKRRAPAEPAAASAAVTPPAKRRITPEARARLREAYYSGSYFGASSALTMFLLARELNRATNDVLW
jgi:cell division control protein 45